MRNQIQKDVEALKDLLVTVKIPSETKRTMNEILTRISTASSTEATELKTISHRELQVGDNVDLGFPGGGWSMAKVTDISNGMITFFRPWMDATDQYPRVGFEVFKVYQDSDKTVQLFDRKEN